MPAVALDAAGIAATLPPGTIKPAKPRHSNARVAAATFEPAADYAMDPGIERWYRERSAVVPLSDHPVYCHGYGCEFQTPVPIDAAGLAELQRIFAGHSGSAAAERKAVSAAVTWWELRASPLLGGPPRQHGSDLWHAHHRGATDCIDEATNSTTILVFLARHGFLRYHRVERPESRGIVVNAHSTAILREIGGEAWAVDMWMHNMGEAPDVMPYAVWVAQW